MILIAIIVFGKLFGLVGMLLAIPIAAILVFLYSKILLPWLELRQELKDYRREMESGKKQSEAASERAE